MSDTDIDFLDFEAAREYVLAFITALKKTQRERAVTEEELSHWEGRVKLAAGREEPILKKGAEARVAELQARRDRLLQEERQLERKVDVLKEKLRATKIRSALRVDADALLAQLQMPAGEPDPLKERLRGMEADEALAELKRRMQEERDG